MSGNIAVQDLKTTEDKIKATIALIGEMLTKKELDEFVRGVLITANPKLIEKVGHLRRILK